MNKRIFKILIIILIFQGCNQETEVANGNSNLNHSTKGLKSKIKLDSSFFEPLENGLENICNCDWIVDKELTHYTDLTFSNNGIPFENDSLTKWIENPNRLKIKSLRLIDFKNIPTEMSIFENVELIYLEAINNKNIQGLELFPKLKFLQAEEEEFEITKETKWIKNIEIIYANKTKFSGLKSFMQMSNLKELKFSFSGFNVFPADLNRLKCLTYFQTSAHTFCEIDLTKLDFSKMPCLKHIEFQSWRDNITGIPRGMENIKNIKISHPNLTKKEKEELKKL